MECSEAKKLSLLDAGGDLYVDEQAALQQHLRHCDACNSYAAGMVPVMSVLSSLRDTPVTWQPISVWPAVGASIRLRSASVAPVRRFNLQVAALAVCSLSLAAVVIVQTLSTMRLADDRPQVLSMPQLQPAPADVRTVPVMMGQSGYPLQLPQSSDPTVF